MRQILAALLAASALPAQALTEVKWANDVSGSFTNETMWTQKPVSGQHFGTLDRDCDYTVTFPAGGTAAFSPQFRTPFNDNATDSKKLTLDFEGTFEWLDSTDDTEIYNGEPFKFYNGAGHFFNWENWGGFKKYGPAYANGAKVTLWQDKLTENGQWGAYIRIERGELSMRETASDGTGLGGTLVVGAGVPDGNFLSVVFDNEAVGKYSNGQLRLNGADCLFAVRGGSDVEFKNDFQFPAGANDVYKSTLEVSGEGSYLKVPNFRFLDADSSQRDVNVIVKDKGVLDVSNDFRQNNKGYGKIVVSKEGDFRIRTTGGNFMKQADSRIDIDISDNGYLTFTGNGRWGWNEANESCSVNLKTAGGTIRFVNEDGNRHDWNRSWTVEPGTKVEIGPNMTLSFADNTPNDRAPITADFSAAETTGEGILEVGRNWPANFVMTNGTMRTGGLIFGRSSTATTYAEIGGTAQVTVTGDGFSVGYDALTKVVLKDQAVLDVNNIRTSRSGGYGTNVLEIVGGTLRVAANSAVNLADDGNAKGRTTVNLFGGDMYANGLRGWSGAKWRSGKMATCVFQGNGGTLHAHSDTDDFLWGMDEAYLGTKGLTVDTDYRVQIRQDFAVMEGEEKGVLTLKGRGLKQICANTRADFTPLGTGAPTETVCCGGKTVFGSGVAWKTSLVVTDGAVASFADPGNSVGNSAGMTLAGLSLGEAAERKIGYLELDASDRIVVDGPVAFSMAQLMFTSTPGNGTYPLITVLDAEHNLDNAARTGWQRMILAAGHAASGHSYTYTVTNEEDGSATLAVVIADAQPLEDSDLLIYDDDGQETLDDDVTIGALTFDSAGTSVSGEGLIGFKDSGYAAIDVLQGEHELAVPLVTPAQLPVDVVNGAKLTISEEAGLAGLAKTGAGGLALTDLRFFPGLLSLNGGVTTLGVDGETDEIRLDKVEINAPAKTPVAVIAAQPVVWNDFTYRHGLFVKGGADPLTIERSVNQDVNIFNDEPNDPQNVDMTLTDRSLTASEDPYGGLTVVEGDLVLKGTIGDPSNPDTLGRYNNIGKIALGVRNGAKDNAAVPRIVFDHVRAHSNKHAYIPAAYDKDQVPWNEVGVVVTNGAFVKLDTVHFFSRVGNVDLANRPVVRVDVSGQSTFDVYYACELMVADNRGRLEVAVREGSRFLSSFGNDRNNGFTVNGDGIDLTVTGGSVFGAQNSDREWTTDIHPCKLRFFGGARDNHFRFTDGGVFYCDRLRVDNTDFSKTNTFHFDGGIWDVGVTNYNFVFRYGNLINVVAEGEGLVLAPAEDKTWNFYTGVTGTDVVKNGKGTLVFEKNAYLTDETWGPDADLTSLTENPATAATLAITGTLRVNEGTVRIADAAAVAGTCALAVVEGATVDLGGNAVAFTGLSGAGTVANGTVEGLTYAFGDEVPTFDRLAGSVKVDFGGAAEFKTTYVVGHYDGTEPPALTVKAINTGLMPVRAVVTFEDGDIKVGFVRTSFAVFVR